MSKPYLAFSELTKRVYIVHANGKEDVTDWISTYAQQKLHKHDVSGSVCQCDNPDIAVDPNDKEKFCTKCGQQIIHGAN